MSGIEVVKGCTTEGTDIVAGGLLYKAAFILLSFFSVSICILNFFNRQEIHKQAC